MTADQLDQVHSLCEKLWVQVHDLVDTELADVDQDVAELVRIKMTEQFRFWKGIDGIT
jgi:hypothetical protein